MKKTNVIKQEKTSARSGQPIYNQS